MAKKRANGPKEPTKDEKTAEIGEVSVESTSGIADPVLDAIPPEVHETTAPVQAAEPVAAAKGTAEDEETPAPEQPVVTATTSATSQTPPAPARQKSGFLPLVFGGLIAGIIGYGLAYMNTGQTNDELHNQISQLRADLDALPEFDPDAIAQVRSELGSEIAAIEAQTSQAASDLDQRISALESLPRGEGIASVPAIAAYEEELNALRAQISEMSQTAELQLEDAREEVAAIEENAEAAARAAAGRAALARIQSAMETGAPLGAALTDLENVLEGPAPDPLRAAIDGVPTLSSLQERFPDAARAALTTARSEGVAGEETSGLGAFFRSQFEVRSVTPKEGSDVDAVLSRAESAIRQGRLADALAETASLPEVARAEMSAWLSDAELRASAVAATDTLLDSFNDN